MKRLISLLLLCLFALQAEAKFTASVDRSQLSEGETLELTLESDDPSLFGRPDIRPLDEHFLVLGSRQFNRITSVNGKTQSITRWLITLQPRSSGKLVIPAMRLGDSSSDPINLEVSQAQNSDDSQQLAPVFVDASVDQETAYVQAQIILTLRIHHSVPLYDDSSLSALQMADARIEPLGNPRNYEKLINGVRHGVIEVRYAIFPQKSGTLEIPGQVFNATQVAERQSDPFNPFAAPMGRPIRVVSPSIPLHIKAKPAEYPKDAPWLPARALSLNETWSPQPEQAKAGETLTRNLMLKVEGLSSAQLPPLPQNLPNGLRHYPDQPQLADEKGQQGVVGSREEREALIAEQPGQLELPALEVVWWNTQTDRLERSRLPARTLQIAANPQLDSPDTAESSATPAVPALPQVRLWPWQLACALLSLSTLLGFALWWRARRLPAVRVAVNAPSSRSLLDELRRACQANQPQATRQALDAWARQQPETLAQMAERFTPLANALDALNGALYSDSEDNRNWRGAALWQAIQTLPSEQPPHPASSLPPLYPR